MYSIHSKEFVETKSTITDKIKSEIVMYFASKGHKVEFPHSRIEIDGESVGLEVNFVRVGNYTIKLEKPFVTIGSYGEKKIVKKLVDGKLVMEQIYIETMQYLRKQAAKEARNEERTQNQNNMKAQRDEIMTRLGMKEDTYHMDYHEETFSLKLSRLKPVQLEKLLTFMKTEGIEF